MPVREYMTRKIDPSLIPSSPDFSFEIPLWKENVPRVAGIDEAGRGSLAGPVAAAAVIFPPQPDLAVLLKGVRDSKQLTPQNREKLSTLIQDQALTWGIGYASPQEIDSLGILPATRLAVQRALDVLAFPPQHLLVDYLILPENGIPQTRLVKGDARSLSIAAASILAKTLRDRKMLDLHQRYPHFDWSNNKGYGTSAHRQAILQYGPCPQHRLTFAPARDLV